MTNELKRVYRYLDAAGIPILAFKGPVSAHTLYDDPGYRIFCDLDLLIPRQCITDARKILSEYGYQPSGSPKIAVAREASLSRFTELSLENTSSGIHVDLHWDLTPADWIVSMPGGIWERTRMVSIGGSAVRTLGEEDTFIYFCLHASKHGWSNLAWLVDLCSLIVRSPGIVDRSLALADRDPTATGMIYFALAAAGVMIPDLPVQVELAREIVNEALSGMTPDETILSRLGFQWRTGNGLATFHFVLRRLFTPNQDDWNSLPIRHRRLLFLLIPWRLIRLSWEFAAAMMS